MNTRTQVITKDTSNKLGRIERILWCSSVCIHLVSVISCLLIWHKVWLSKAKMNSWLSGYFSHCHYHMSALLEDQITSGLKTKSQVTWRPNNEWLEDQIMSDLKTKSWVTWRPNQFHHRCNIECYILSEIRIQTKYNSYLVEVQT